MTNYLAVHSEMTRKRPRFGAIPKVNMPKKNHETPKPQPREQDKICLKIFTDTVNFRVVQNQAEHILQPGLQEIIN